VERARHKPRSGWSDDDRRMVDIAKDRGGVWWLNVDGHEQAVTLLCWRGNVGDRKARIEFPMTGARRTVDVAEVRPIAVPA
jgi:hypothetical protein